VSPARIARNAFLIVAVGLALLGTVIRNDWTDLMVMISMAITGLGEGALVTLLFNVLVTASPKELAGDVGSVRGATNNLATAVGTALAGALIVSLLTTGVHKDLIHNARIPIELKAQFDLDSVPFISNDQLRQTLQRTGAPPEQIDEAVRINVDARLLALKLTFFTFAGFALLAFFPAGSLPTSSRTEDSPLEAERTTKPEHRSAIFPTA
jgi:MFS family permease